MRICSVEGCNNQHLARGWCNKHYKRWCRHGDPNAILHKEICSVENCNNAHFAKNWCQMHYTRWKRHGDISITLKNYGIPNLCIIKECNKPYHAKGYCYKHYENYSYKTNIQHKIANVLRSRLYSAIKNRQKSGSAIRDLGCSIDIFMYHIENQFEDSMTWNNYGEWHLDHVMPLAHFDLENKQEFLEACNWLNYQPLWAKDNLSKGDRT